MHTAPIPYTGGYMNPESPYPPPMQGAVPYIDSHARPHVHMGVWPAGEGRIPYGSSIVMAAGGTAFPATGIATAISTGVAAVPTSGGVAVPPSGGAVMPNSADFAVPASRGASTSTSGGDAIRGGSSDPANAQE